MAGKPRPIRILFILERQTKAVDLEAAALLPHQKELSMDRRQFFKTSASVAAAGAAISIPAYPAESGDTLEIATRDDRGASVVMGGF
ncbi:MAG: twin-arginine translocation signal domain-containing protein, partial [Candidatus Hydrogenedentes bacterium]|nr:twin-arginine translocation signal domain-containing protein [Candidatus Hydrogenedentota bacterium]